MGARAHLASHEEDTAAAAVNLERFVPRPRPATRYDRLSGGRRRSETRLELSGWVHRSARWRKWWCDVDDGVLTSRSTRRPHLRATRRCLAHAVVDARWRPLDARPVAAAAGKV